MRALPIHRDYGLPATPERLRSDPFLVLELRPGAEDGLLFKRRLLPELPSV